MYLTKLQSFWRSRKVIQFFLLKPCLVGFAYDSRRQHTLCGYVPCDISLFKGKMLTICPSAKSEFVCLFFFKLRRNLFCCNLGLCWFFVTDFLSRQLLLMKIISWILLAMFFCFFWSMKLLLVKERMKDGLINSKQLILRINHVSCLHLTLLFYTLL